MKFVEDATEFVSFMINPYVRRLRTGSEGKTARKLPFPCTAPLSSVTQSGSPKKVDDEETVPVVPSSMLTRLEEVEEGLW